MLVDISLWRARIGLFLKYRSTNNIKNFHFRSLVSLLFALFLILSLAWPLILYFFILILAFIFWYGKYLFYIKFSKMILSKNFRTLSIVSVFCVDFLFSTQLFIAIVLKMLLINSGCVETNPGPDSKINFGVWNLDSLLTRDKHKINLIEGINSVKNFDMFGVVESYLTPEINDDQLEIHGFSPIPFRADSTSIGRPRGGVCLYYRVCQKKETSCKI